MQSLEGIRRSISTAEDLQSVVRMMKGVAAANIREFERAVASLGDYSRAIELGIQTLLRSRPERLVATAPTSDGRLGAVVFGSDQGMCGRFNQQIATHAVTEIKKLAPRNEDRTILIVGARILALLEMDALEIDERVATTTSLAGITSLVQEILMHIESWRERGAADRILLFYNEALGGAKYEPHTHQLFPVDFDWLRELRSREWPSNRLPIYTIDWDGLFSSLIREHLYIGIFRAAAESLASENASRLASMQVAERNIDDRLEELQVKYRHKRQQTITEELLDIISGFEALSTP